MVVPAPQSAPAWANDLALAYESGASSQFILFGNVHDRLAVNTNTLDHPGALATYRKAGFHVVRSEAAELRDPRVLWPEVYRWPPK